MTNPINKTPDSDVVAFLNERENYESDAATARALGRTLVYAEKMRGLARDRGLVAGSRVVTAETKLKHALSAAQADVKRLQVEHDTAEMIRERIYGLAERTPEPPAWLTEPPGRLGVAASPGTPMTIWSDWHYGEVVRPEEVGGTNEFNADIAARRITHLVDTTIDLLRNHSGVNQAYPGIVIMLGGDMLTGTIHEELANTNDRTTQQAINELTDLLAAALERMADEFGKVFVPAVVGNHGRSTKKVVMKGRVYTSHEWNIYVNLERHFRKDKRIQFFIPNESDAYFKVYNHRFLLTHGDSLGVKGGDGIIGAIGPIMRGTLKTSKSEAEIGRQFDTIVMGHWHQMLWLPGGIVNNCLKGFDEFARLVLRAPFSVPSQALWLVHPKWGITARWEVKLEEGQGGGPRDEQQWLTWQKD